MHSDGWIVLFVVALNVLALVLASRRELKVAIAAGGDQR
jgi:hypothetical protein